MIVLILTSNHTDNKIKVRQDQIIAMEDLPDSGFNKTRVHLKGDTFLDVSESISDIKAKLE